MEDINKDIEILENVEPYGLIKQNQYNFVTKEKYIQAQKNLIQAYKELEEYKKIAELTKISCCTAQNCEALNNSIKAALENMKLKEKIKELEEENKVWKNNYYEQKEFNNKQALYITENFISVSLVEEKIEWLEVNILDNEYASDNDKDIAEYQVQALQELLEKRK